MRTTASGTDARDARKHITAEVSEALCRATGWPPDFVEGARRTRAAWLLRKAVRCGVAFPAGVVGGCFANYGHG